MPIKVRIQRSRRNRTASGLSDLLKLFFLEPMKKARQIQMHEAKLIQMQDNRQVAELERQIKSNKLVLLDIEIERKKLELQKLKREVGDPDAFAKPMS